MKAKTIQLSSTIDKDTNIFFLSKNGINFSIWQNIDNALTERRRLNLRGIQDIELSMHILDQENIPESVTRAIEEEEQNERYREGNRQRRRDAYDQQQNEERYREIEERRDKQIQIEIKERIEKHKKEEQEKKDKQTIIDKHNKDIDIILSRNITAFNNTPDLLQYQNFIDQYLKNH